MRINAKERDRQLALLRKLIEDKDSDALTKRIAYAIEQAVRYVTSSTHGWPTLDAAAKDEASTAYPEVAKEISDLLTSS